MRLSTRGFIERPLDLNALEALDLIARLDIVVLLHANAALGARLNFFGVVFKAPE